MKNRLKVLLLMDVGGSMDPFAHLVSRLFSAAHKAAHFKEFHAFYFHNCIYEQIYKTAKLELDFAEVLKQFDEENGIRLIK